MFRIADGREHFYQWDIDRQIIVEDSTITEVHFCNRTDDCSLVTEVKDGRADVPNILLQSSYDMRVFGYDGKATLYEKKFKVSARTRPADYIYTETEIRTVQTVVDRANLTLDQTNEALKNTEEAIANTEIAITNANEAVEIANTANERAEVAISDVERFANEAKESAEQAQAAVVNYYTKEEHATNYSDAKEVAYMQFGYDYTNWKAVPDEYAKIFDRISAGEHITLYIKDFYAYAVADINVPTIGASSLFFRTHYTDHMQKEPTTTITEFTATKALGRWEVKLNGRTTNTFATKTYVDESVDKCVTEEELEAKGYLTATDAASTYATNERLESWDTSLRNDVSEALNDVEDFVKTNYAKKSEIPSLDGYATEAYVNTAIEGIDIPEPDLTGYATEKYVDDAIANIDIPEPTGSGVKVLIIRERKADYSEEEMTALYAFAQEQHTQYTTIPSGYVFYFHSDNKTNCIPYKVYAEKTWMRVWVFAADGAFSITINFSTDGKISSTYRASEGGNNDDPNAWHYCTSDAGYYELYNAKEVYILAQDDSNSSKQIFSHVVFDNSVLGYNTYVDYAFTTPEGYDGSVPYWSYTGSSLSFSFQVTVKTIAYKK